MTQRRARGLEGMTTSSVGEPVLSRYERIAFEKDLIAPQGQALAALCGAHSSASRTSV